VESLRKLKKAAERVIDKVKNTVKGAAKNAHFVSLSEEPAPALRRYFIDRSLPDRSKMDILAKPRFPSLVKYQFDRMSHTP
jgi:hypothetical protein